MTGSFDSSCLQWPHVFLSAGGTRNAELKVPFVHNKTFLDNEQQDYLGALVIRPWSQLLVGPSAIGQDTIAQLAVYVHFPDAKLRILNPIPDPEVVALRRENATLKAAAAEQKAEYVAEAQMSVQDIDDAVVANDPAPPDVHTDESMKELAPPSIASNDSTRHPCVGSLADILKRQTLFYRDFPDTNFEINLGELFIGNTNIQPNGSILRYVAAMYRVWKGTFVFTVSTKTHLWISWSAYCREDSIRLLLQTIGSTIASPMLVGCGPTTFVNAPQNLQTFKIPFQSQYSLLQMPRTVGDLTQPSACSGKIVFVNQTADSNGSIYVAGGDDLRFGYLYCIPKLVKVAPPPF